MKLRLQNCSSWSISCSRLYAQLEHNQFIPMQGNLALNFSAVWLSYFHERIALASLRSQPTSSTEEQLKSGLVPLICKGNKALLKSPPKAETSMFN